MASLLMEHAPEMRFDIASGLALSYTNKGNFKLGRSKFAVLLPADMFAKIFSGLEANFGTGAYTIAKLSGDELGKATASDLKISTNQRERVMLVKEIFQSKSTYDWGHYKLLRISEDPFQLRFRLHDVPSPLRKKGGQPFRFFLIGFFEDFLRTIMEMPVRCIEHEASANSAFYEFSFVRM